MAHHETAELREMSDEHLELTLKETCDNYFRLKIQAQTERLDAPTELARNRKKVARIKTILTERNKAALAAAASAAVADAQSE